jgi:tRNA dimethylallyltransferase
VQADGSTTKLYKPRRIGFTGHMGTRTATSSLILAERRERLSSGAPTLPPLVAVLGPTASGKSALALALAEALDGEIISADSLQVYRGLDIGTAKPSLAERARVPHHLLDVAEPDEPYSVGRYVDDARAALANIAARGRAPILCGGTGLYYRALLFGLAHVPAVPHAVQAAVDARVAGLVATEGAPAAHAALARVDPEAAARVHPHDAGRIARALGVYEATGQPLSAWRRAQPFGAGFGTAPASGSAAVLAVGLAWERAALYARVNDRVREMLARGWIEEVAGLLARGYDPRLKPLRAIGYAEIVQHLRPDEGERLPAETLAERIAQRTRHYAKRQLTWFRRHPELRWAAPEDAGRLQDEARKFLLRHGLGR